MLNTLFVNFFPVGQMHSRYAVYFWVVRCIPSIIFKKKTIKGKKFSHSILQAKLSFPCLVVDIFNEVPAIFFNIPFDKYTVPILCQVWAMYKVCVGVQDN